MSTRVAGLLLGIVFGVTLSWSGMTSPEIIREGLLFQSTYLFFFFGAAMMTAMTGLYLLKRKAPIAPLTGERVQWETIRPERRHVIGSLLFGVGWGLSDACPGPIATQLGQGIAWGIPTCVGLITGIVVFRRMQARSAADPERARAPSKIIPARTAADATA